MTTKICVVTDEISADPETAIELAVSWGIRDVELRGFYDSRIPMITEYQKLLLKKIVSRMDVKIVAISPGLFKIPLPGDATNDISLPWLDKIGFGDWDEAKKRVDYHLNTLLPLTIDFAHQFDAKQIVTFAFHRGGLPAGPAPAGVIEYLYQAAEKAQSHDIELIIENETGCWADTGERSAEVLRRVGHKNLGLNWDPGNAFLEGEIPFPYGYQFIRDWVRHVHYKNVKRSNSGSYDFEVDGEIDWEGQVAALEQDGYDGYISIETHARPKVKAAKLALKKLMDFTNKS